ncbi:MAG TPA: M14 metallopeptidase family protein [Thermoanaerobaculia bacterium]|nr:M14 metallopeptidase family protein [Thermoanaerobaculia bacterium]
MKRPVMPLLLLVCLAGLSAPPAVAAQPAPPPAAPSAAAAPDPLLPAGTTYDPAVPSPAAELGWPVGEWHVSHDRLVAYMRRLAETSERVRLEVQGQSHEGRPLVLLTISSPANLARLGDIRRAHRALSEPPFDDRSQAPSLAGQPAVVWLGYSIHGDEASGSNAALLVAYHLAAGRGAEVERLLEHTVVLLDPSLNPDGLSRFAHWANTHRGRVLVADPEHREHVQAWPSGRTNHYWYDLNRDWLAVQQPESRARVATMQRWRPSLVADFHEMGADSTYFFQPGVPSRQNPLTPPANLELTRAIARYHAEAFDRAGVLYYSEETFDDFFFGKGSTYPDIQGAVGILFEQASSRGHLQETDQGLRSFRDAIGNHVLTSLSTLWAAADKREELLAYQRDFYRRAMAQAQRAPQGGWVVADGGDPARAWHLLDLLTAHGIEVHRLARPLEVGGETFRPGEAWLVPAQQRQVSLATALFERRTEFPDATFYDVSAWTLPLAFDLTAAEVPRARWSPGLLGERVLEPVLPPGRLPSRAAAGGVPPYAWLFEWRGYYAPRALHRLLAAGVVARVATRPFEAETDAGHHRFGYGTVVLPAGLQTLAPERVAELLATVAREDGVDVWAVATGLTVGGADLGSPSLRPLERPKVALAVGHHVASSEAGEVWHLLDQRYRMPLSLVDKDRLGRIDLDRYTHLVLVSGRYDELGEAVVGELAGWLRRGGTLVAIQGAAHWATRALLNGRSAASGGSPGAGGPDAEAGEEAEADEATARRPYADYDADRAVDLVAGAIFEVELDTTHPLAYGYDDPLLPVFRESTAVLEPSANPYENVALYAAAPLLAGYASPANAERLAGTAAAIATRVGRGTLIRLADDPTFRAFWLGTDKLLANALFFGPVVRSTPVPKP